MDAKKISFGFSKITKKPNLLVTNKAQQNEESQVELIKCLEGQEIKLVEEKSIAGPLIIPLKDGQKTSAALASLMKRRAVLLGEPDEPLPEAPEIATTNGNGTLPVDETLEQRAARELLAQAQSNGNTAEDANQNLVLPVLKPDELPLDGAKQSTMDDYESIPVDQFGRAMLRGMGWVEPPKQKKAGDDTADDMPFVRPKGMGLGADKALKAKPLLVPPEKNEVLEIRKQAYVRILGGKFKDQYGQIEGFDDHAARVIVKLAIGGAKEAFNEFLCQPVSKKEFTQYGKCINSTKYEEYKKMENEHGQIIIKKEDIDLKSRVKKESSEVKSERRPTHDSGSREGYDHEKPSSTSRREHKHESRDGERHKQRSVKSESRKHNQDEHRDASCSRTRRDVDRERAKRLEREDERHYDKRKPDAREQSKRKSREREREREHSNSYEERRVPSASSSSQRRQQYTDDTSASSGTDSDSDSAYERKHKKKSNHNHHKSKSKAKAKTKAKKKSSKKSKHRKQKQRDASDTDATDDSASSSSSSDDDDVRHRRQHKKKTKKSKKPRSRTRSRSHSRNARR